jgi:hypothetical protein
MIGSADELRGGARDGSSAVSRGLGLARDAAASDEQQRQNDRDCIAQALNLTRRPCSVSWNLVYSASGADVAHLRIRAYCAGLEQLCHGLPRQGSREEEALCDIAATLAQEIELLDRLDPFSDHAFA